MDNKGAPNKSDLRKVVCIRTNILAKISENQFVSIKVLTKKCSSLDYGISNIRKFKQGKLTEDNT